MSTNSTAKIRISLGLDGELKALIDAEAKQLEINTPEYLRKILKNRSKILNATETEIGREELENLKTENERLRQLVNDDGTETQEITALQAENEALRADMALLRTESENSADPSVVATMEQDLIKANLLVEKAEARLSELKEAHDAENQKLISEHEKVRAELVEELNSYTCVEMTDWEADMVAQHEEEFNAIAAKFREEKAASAQKSILIEELRAKIAEYATAEANKVDLNDTHEAKLETLSTQISECERELADTKDKLGAETQMVAELSSELEDKKADYVALYDEMKETKEQLNRLRIQSEEVYNKHEEQCKENQQISSEIYSQAQIIETFEESLRDANFRYQQLFNEKMTIEKK